MERIDNPFEERRQNQRLSDEIDKLQEKINRLEQLIFLVQWAWCAVSLLLNNLL